VSQEQILPQACHVLVGLASRPSHLIDGLEAHPTGITDWQPALPACITLRSLLIMGTPPEKHTDKGEGKALTKAVPNTIMSLHGNNSCCLARRSVFLDRGPLNG
jgi:hypothetical protein